MAKAAGTLKLSLDEVSQTINLSKEAGIDLSNDPSLINSIGQDIIDYMVQRTEAGKAIGGNKDLKKPYSIAYIKSAEFKAFGKKPNEVNMTLTGDMLGAIDLTNTDSDKLKIEIVEDLQVKKSFNHNTGDTVPKRDFFGITASELDDILAKHSDEIDNIKNELVNTKQSILESITQSKLIDIINKLTITGV